MRIKGVKTLYFSGAERFANFLLDIEICLVIDPRPNSLPRERQFMSQQDHMWLPVNTWCLLWKHSCAFLLMVLFLRSIITDWLDENKRTKKLGSQVWENLCRSLYSNKCLRLASEKFVLASGSNLSLATGLASWKISLEPWTLCFRSTKTKQVS